MDDGYSASSSSAAPLVGKRGRKVSHITASSLVWVASRDFSTVPGWGPWGCLGDRAVREPTSMPFVLCSPRPRSRALRRSPDWSGCTGTLMAFSWKSNGRGQKEQITKLWASKVWWVGGHVVLAHDRTEVINVEGVRVVTPIPAHNIQRVVVVDVFVDAVSGFDGTRTPRTRQRSRKFRTCEVTFVIRRVFEELAGLLECIAVAARYEIRLRFNDHGFEGVLRLRGCRRRPAVNRAFGNDEVVAFPEGDRPNWVYSVPLPK